MSSQLYIIGTPLGNIEDVTLRALAKLKELNYFFVEDTREFHKLLGLLQIDAAQKKAFSYASHNMKESTEKALQILSEGNDIGFLTDRGTPAISDPGALLVDEALRAGVTVRPIPGPSSVTSLVSVAGLKDPRFAFIGFFPQGKKERQELFTWVKQTRLPLVFLESPQRVRDSFNEIKSAFPGGRLFIGREMTKLYEEFRWIDLSTANAEVLLEKGEYSLILDPSALPEEAISELEEAFQLRTATDKEWSKAMAAKYGVASSDLYNRLQRSKTRS